MIGKGKKTAIFLVGNGGHAKVVRELINGSPEYEICGIISLENERDFLKDRNQGSSVFIAIGDNALRKAVAERYADKAFVYPNFFHPYSLVSASVKMGQGNIFMPGSIVNASASLGDFCVINTGAILEHDCYIDNYVSLAPGATICGSCEIGEGAYMGARCVVSQGRRVGRWTVVGAGAAVVKDVTDNSINVGVPASMKRLRDPNEPIL